MKNHLKVIIILISVFFSQKIISQASTDLRPAIKTPEVDKFEQYVNMPVNLVSGTPKISIPIYNLAYRGMSLPISLDYDASGVKIEDISSSVGLKWSLNVGGTVSRIIKGSPDEGGPFVGNNESQILTRGYYLDNGFSNLNSTLNTIPDTGTRYGKFSVWMNDVFNSYLDAQPDLFSFSTPEGSSKFVFNDHREIVYLENTDFLVDETFTAGEFASWSVISPNGIKYSFGVNNLKEKSVISNVGETLYQYKTDAWFLNEMFNYATNDKITFEYIDNNYSTIINKSPSKITSPCLAILQNGSQCGAVGEATGYEYFAQSPYSDSSTNPDIFSGGGNGPNLENHSMSKLISKIKAGNTEISFIYSVRNDVAPIVNSIGSVITAKRLDEIQVLQNGVCVKKFKFNYVTTVSSDVLPSGPSGQPNSSVLKTRLVLSSFVESSCDGLVVKPYIFNYNAQVLPNKLSYAQDKWGYYNGKLSNTSLVPRYKLSTSTANYSDRMVDFSFAKAGVLEKITYPTKGTVSFEYESHKSDVPTDSFYDPTSIGNLVSGLQPTPSADPWANSSFNQSDFVYNNADEALLISSTLMFPHPMSNIASCGDYSFSSTAVEIVDKSTNIVIARLSYNDVTSTVPKTATSKSILYPENLVVGKTYTCKVYGWGYYGHCLHNMTTIERHKIIPVYDVGGLRVNKITHKNHDNTIAKEFNYTYFQPKVTSNPKPIYKIDYNYLNSYDALQSYPTILSYSNVSSFKNYILNNNANYLSGYYYYVSTGTDFLDVNFIGPNITYGKVIEADGNGKTEHNFNTYKSYFELNGYVEPKQIPAEPKFQSLLAGEKISVIQYDQSNNIKKNNQSVYNYNNNYTKTSYPVVGLNVNRNEYGCIYYPYTIQGQLKTLKTESETTKLNSLDVTTTSDYEYRTDNNHFQPIKITTSTSEGEQLIKKMYYSGDMLPETQELFNQNRKATPIRTETFNGTTKLSEQRTVYANDVSTSSLVLPKYIYAANFPNSLPVLTTPNVGQLEKKVTSDKYGINGNLLQFTPENGSPVTIIWGYDKTQPIAKIENASYAQIASALGITTTVLDTYNESNLTTINNLRTNASLPNIMVTTYTYVPQVGVSSITDPKGLITYYEYDNFGRLKFVKDKDQNVLQRNCYNYKGQSVDCSQIEQPVPGVPTGLALSSSSSSTLNFSWAAVVGATGYKIYKNGVYVSSTTATSGSLSGLSSATTYGVQVLAYNGTGDGNLCSTVSMTTASASSTDACSISFNRTSGTATFYKNGTSYLSRTTSGTSSGTLTTGDTFYVTVSASVLYFKNLTITSSVRGVLFSIADDVNGTVLNSGTFTKMSNEIITVDCSTTSAE